MARVTYPGYKKYIYVRKKIYGACKLTRTSRLSKKPKKKKPEKKKRKKHFQTLINSENCKKKIKFRDLL